MSKNYWTRVSRHQPCPICKKTDWCLISKDASAAICARVESVKPVGNQGAGWFHRLTNEGIRVNRFLSIAETQTPTMDWTGLARACYAAMNAGRWQTLGETLGISTATLSAMKWGWCNQQQSWTVPMRNDAGRIIGIRTRRLDGCKRAITGSKSGLFYIPERIQTTCLVICEGPSDAATLIDLGLDGVVGRPSCNGGTELLVQLIRRHRYTSVLLFPDRDKPGLDGAKQLACAIAGDGIVPVHRIGGLVPPKGTKDCREWQKKNPDDLARMIGASIRNLTTSTKGYKA